MLTRYLRLLALAVVAISLPVAAHHVDEGGAPGAAANQSLGAEETLSGVIDELIVIDRVNSETHRYPILRQADGSRVALRGDAIQTLTAGAKATVAGTQTGVSFTVAQIVAQADGPKSSPSPTARVEGRFMVAHSDNFETGTSRFIYQVFDAGDNATDIALPFLPGPLGPGMRVVVDGTLATDGKSVIAGSIEIQSIPEANALPATTNYLVLPIKFPASGSGTALDPWVYNADPFTPATLNTSVFGALPTKSAKEYYKEASYGLQQLSGITADDGSGGFLKATVAKPATCDINVIANAAAAAARARGYPIDASGNPTGTYTGILYVFNGVSGCGWSGLAYVGYARAYSNNTPALWVIGHELGHNFGLLHAGSLNCTGAPIGCGASGTVAEYGDPFNTMGNSGNTGHFDAAQKSILGWIAPSTVKTHAGGTVTYTLSPIETGGQSTYAVKIPTTNANRTYWIEYRQPAGVFDAFIVPPGYPNAGAQIRIEYPFEKSSGSDDTEILDMTPATQGNFHDAALLAGAPAFVDASTNLSINVISATPGAAGALTVQVATSTGTPTTTTLASSLNPSNPGSGVTFTATVTGLAPTGSVSFTDGGASIAGCASAVVSGIGNVRTASCFTSSLTAGTHSIVATYSGDAANAPSTSSALSQVVKSASTTTLASSANPSAVGANVTFTASVTGIAPTGNVNFTNGGLSLTGCSAVTLAGSGNTRTATCSTSTLAAGTRSIVAAYGGDAGNAASTSSTLSQVVKAASTTTVASSLNPSTFGANVTFTATVTGTAPTGSVNFKDGATSLAGCSAVAFVAGIGNTRSATCSTASLSVATHSITASYGGDAGNVPSASATLSQVVQASATPTTTTLASSLDPSTFGANVTFTATVTGTAPTGSVNFKDGATSIAGCSAVAFAAGSGNTRSATCSTASLSVATHSITASYGGDAGNNPSTSTALSQVVQASAAPTTTTLASSPNPSTFGANVTFTATVTGTAPTGSVNFKDGATSIAGCSAVAFAAGSGNTRSATCSTASLSVATHSITASYGGDAGNNPSTSTALSQVVTSGGGGSINVALAANGGVASASSSLGAGYPASAVNNGERAGLNWGAGGGWNDSTLGVFPDWVQINFSGTKTLDHVVVYSVQDNWQNPIDPPATLTFSLYGVTDFQVQGWNGSAWVTLGTVTGNNLVKRTVTFAPTTTDRIRINITNALYQYSRVVEVEAWTVSGGGTASATTLASSLNPANVGAPVTFTATVTGTAPTGSVNFTDGGAAIAGCSAVAFAAGSGNTRSAACTTSALTAGSHTIGASYSGDAGNTGSSATLAQTVNSVAQINVALAANGGVASASSSLGAGYPASAVNNGERAGLNWGAGGGWNDSTLRRVSGLGADQLQRHQDPRPCGRLFGPGQLAEPDRSAGDSHLQPVRRHRLPGAGLERQRLGHTGHGHRQQPGQAHRDLRAHHHRAASASTSPAPCTSTRAMVEVEAWGN